MTGENYLSELTHHNVKKEFKLCSSNEMLVPRTGKKGKPERCSDSEGKNFFILKKLQIRVYVALSPHIL